MTPAMRRPSEIGLKTLICPPREIPDMSKEPSVEHIYHSKKDRLDITIKHYALVKRADREKIIMKLLKELQRSPAPSIASAKASKKQKSKLPKSPPKESKLPVTGD
jgi:hypothetical protein